MLKFTKMHGCGNDYVYVNCFENEVKNPEALSVPISDRHFGVGSDGLILIMPSDKADFRMRMFNNDGSEGKMCGNGSRCVAKYVYDKGLTKKTTVTLETLSGIKTLRLSVTDGKVSSVDVDMGKAILSPREIPVNADGTNFVSREVEVGGKSYLMTCVGMGNPHAVIFTDNVADLPLAQLGPLFENHPLFPEKVNTEFVRVIARNRLEMRVWERGTGETLACGTGTCAAAVAACLCGYCERDTPINVKLSGGELTIIYHSDGGVTMRGGAATVFDGEIDEIALEKEYKYAKA